MAITKSAKKAIRQSQRRRVRNLRKGNKLKNLLKEVKSLITQASAKGGEEVPTSSTSRKKIEEAKKLLPQVYKLLDKAAKTGLIKKGEADRKKSRFARAVK
ncbi:MAG: 30S ribosomal protein S20 [bacterium]|nr:30S ribosomal protein S20 [bacterium]